MFATAAASSSLLAPACNRRRSSSSFAASRKSCVVTRAAAGAGGDLAGGGSGGDDEEDDLPRPIKLNANQARIAAMAFEVLYEKDPKEGLEELFKDKERPGLRLKLQQSIRAANEACKEGATVECAAAWEEVDGLEDAAMRAGMSQNAPSYADDEPSKKQGGASTSSVNKPLTPAAPKKAQDRSADPLAGMKPCQGDECEAPQGTLQARFRLEKLLASTPGGSVDDLSEGSVDELADAISEAVDIAMEMCENGEVPGQCAIAWEVVEELSASASKRKEKRGE
mmetsp:Transcript_1578/g.3596  ORF Transcript_1578/g.3596 Transcript_1578/m.3596 type:complete len:282 (-) Transcript_1578:148-993(-)|eukprot:CAMPEP_0197578232 /NCGR_PEP_ID=MMETSP1326-20131121/2540_1 /TAXON_ID=1155430 /ORGANISM="Genus nov. species nov., Strain RCC2288" /LENGTH=281 /DNA_ID=CAMNT_0043141399 /DNA_START=37 /DNA_END=882 /DNA_ORIENTATION=-